MIYVCTICLTICHEYMPSSYQNLTNACLYMIYVTCTLPCPSPKTKCANHQSKAHDVPPWLPSLSPPPFLAPAWQSWWPWRASSSGRLWRRRPNRRCRSAGRAPAVEKTDWQWWRERWGDDKMKKEQNHICWNDMKWTWIQKKIGRRWCFGDGE